MIAVSVSLSINIASISANDIDLSPSPSVSLCVCVCVCVSRSVSLPVRKVYCGKMADWIRMPLGMVSGVGRGTDVLDVGGDRRKGRDCFGDEFGASHCNQ